MIDCVVYYSSETGNTQNFVERVGIPAVRLAKRGEPPIMDKPYVLIMPTYAAGDGRGALPGDVVAYKCHVPCLYRYELRGMPEDVANVRQILAELPAEAVPAEAVSAEAVPAA